jgi:tetratricopeptide (TPR) repeat protein
VFVAGRERLIGPAGWLGLHQAYVGGPGGTTEAARRIAVGAQLAELVRFGVSEAFARKVVETPPHTYWRPSQRELLAERLATRVVDPAQVAASPRSCRHAPRRADLMASLGALVFNMGSANRALLYLEWAIASDPDHSAALMYRAMSLAHQLQLDRAIEDFDRVINLDPKSVGAFVGRGQIHLQRGDIFRAIRDFDHALSIAYGLAPLEEGVIAAARGVARTKLGQYEGAIADFTRAIELHPSRADLYNARAWAYLKAGKSGHGLPDAERALQLNPAFAAALDTRGQILEALGRHEEAIADFRRALALDPGIEESKEGLKRLGAAP